MLTIAITSPRIMAIIIPAIPNCARASFGGGGSGGPDIWVGGGGRGPPGPS